MSHGHPVYAKSFSVPQVLGQFVFEHCSLPRSPELFWLCSLSFGGVGRTSHGLLHVEGAYSLDDMLWLDGVTPWICLTLGSDRLSSSSRGQ